MLALASLIAASPAGAAVFWSDADPMMTSEPVEPAPPKRPSRPRRTVTKSTIQLREAVKPQGPLVIAISVDRQILRVYDTNGLYAETPVSTGMRGHTTPMGTFSVIQKNKFHRSNIYSGAPMPYMQRITWSGIAMHAGALPGYPASHGCIRMPMAFAVKMWGWTRMGARVVIAPGELSPSEISHPLLATQRPAPIPVATAEPSHAPTVAANIPAIAPNVSMSTGSLELKPSVDDVLAKAVAEATGVKRDQTQTADASGAMVAGSRPTLSDASPASRTSGTINAMAPNPESSKEFNARAAEFRAATDKLLDSTKDAATTVPSIMAETPAVAAKPAETRADKSATAPNAASADTAKDEGRQPDAGQTSGKPDLAEQPRRTGQIAVLISKKDNKLYVRQNFAPLFDVPVTIAASDRPLGTHVFTARADKQDPKTFHWSVVSMPAAPRTIEDDGAARRRKSTGAINMNSAPVPDSAAQALDRIQIPDDAMTKINEALASGSSIIVSDLGIANGGETGTGTDFVVPLR